MKHSRKKKRRAQATQLNGSASVKSCDNNHCGGEEQRIIKSLVEIFSLASIEEAQSAYKEANGDPNKAAEILSGLSESSEVFETSSSSSTLSFGLDSSSNQSFGLDSSSSQSYGMDYSSSRSFSSSDSNGGSSDGVDHRGFRGSKGKKVVATAGTVSSLLGKDYVSPSPRKEMKEKGGLSGGKLNVEEAEQFLCSMLGDDCELSMAVVKDVLCNCGYDVEKALQGLLDLTTPLSEPPESDKYCSSSASSGEYPRSIDDNFWQVTDRGSDSYSHSSASDSQDGLLLLDYTYTGRNYAEALLSSRSSRKSGSTSLGVDGNDIPQQVLESLFNIPKSAEREPSTMAWRNVARQMESFAQKRVDLGPRGLTGEQLNAEAVGKGAEYQVFRESARQQWHKMRTCYQKAATAYSGGEKNYATYMSEQGQRYSKMAREADEKASMEIFKARNKVIENSLTIDLHGQHVKPAMRLVKLHLLFATYISSVQYLRIITGCGSSGLGKSVLKQSVINLFKKEKIAWREENQGTVLVKLDGPREFTFLDSGSDSDTEL